MPIAAAVPATALMTRAVQCIALSSHVVMVLSDIRHEDQNPTADDSRFPTIPAPGLRQDCRFNSRDYLRIQECQTWTMTNTSGPVEARYDRVWGVGLVCQLKPRRRCTKALQIPDASCSHLFAERPLPRRPAVCQSSRHGTDSEEAFTFVDRRGSIRGAGSSRPKFSSVSP